MSEDTSPYQSPESREQPPFIPHSPQPVRSAIPKVIGIIHIVYATIGIVGALMGLAATSFTEKMLEAGNYTDEQISEYMATADRMTPYTYANAAVSVAFGALLLIAGIKLLKYKTQGLKFSNIWSIGRILWAIIFIVLTYNVSRELNQAVVDLDPDTAAIQSNFGVIGMVLGVLMMSAYPIVSYLILNRASVKKELA